MTTTETQTQGAEMLKGKWDRHEGKFVASLRVGGKAAEYVGRRAQVMSKAKEWTTVTLGEVVADFGAGDVALFAVVR